MRILMVHNRYTQAGGEDVSTEAEVRLLRENGHEVHEEIWTNAPPDCGTLNQIGIALNAAWSIDSYRIVNRLCRSFRPDILHVQNFWMKMSPSVHAAGSAAG